MTKEIKSRNEIVLLETEILNQLIQEYKTVKDELQNSMYKRKNLVKGLGVKLILEYKMQIHTLENDKIELLNRLEQLKENATQFQEKMILKLEELKTESDTNEKTLKMLKTKLESLNQKYESNKEKLIQLKEGSKIIQKRIDLIKKTILNFRSTFNCDWQLENLTRVKLIESFGDYTLLDSNFFKSINDEQTK